MVYNCAANSGRKRGCSRLAASFFETFTDFVLYFAENLIHLQNKTNRACHLYNNGNIPMLSSDLQGDSCKERTAFFCYGKDNF